MGATEAQMPPLHSPSQSLSLIQALPGAQPWHEPPQSTSDSSASFTLFTQYAGVGFMVGAGEGLVVGRGVSHTPATQRKDAQSVADEQVLPAAQAAVGAQEPPQSTSVSSPSCTWLMQCAGVGAGVGAEVMGVGAMVVGPGVGCSVKGATDGWADGAGVG